jgi:hypothetical protein
VYLRWRESQVLQDAKQVSKNVIHCISCSFIPLILVLQKNKYLNNWIRVERTIVVEKFKRSQALLKMAKQQQGVVCSEDDNQSDLVSLVDSDSAVVSSESLEDVKAEEGVSTH